MFFKKYFLYGFLLWLFGYILGILLFAFVPPSMIGWVIMPIGTLATILVLVKKMKLTNLKEAILCGGIWVLIAILGDYFFLVKIFKPANYYKFDVFVYYFLTFLLPIGVWVWKKKKPGFPLEFTL